MACKRERKDYRKLPYVIFSVGKSMGPSHISQQETICNIYKVDPQYAHQIIHIIGSIGDTEDLSLEEKCEHLMNIVVESRKRFGKMCIDYEQKITLMENKWLNLQVDNIANYKFKSKQQIPDVDIESMIKDVEDVNLEIMERSKKIEELKKNIRNTQHVVLQLRQDQIGRRLQKPLTAEDMLERAKNKNVA